MTTGLETSGFAPHEINVFMAVLSSFFGAVSGVAVFAWWLAGRFTAVYKKIEERERSGSEHFAKIDMALLRLEMRVDEINRLIALSKLRGNEKA